MHTHLPAHTFVIHMHSTHHDHKERERERGNVLLINIWTLLNWKSVSGPKSGLILNILVLESILFLNVSQVSPRAFGKRIKTKSLARDVSDMLLDLHEELEEYSTINAILSKIYFFHLLWFKLYCTLHCPIPVYKITLGNIHLQVSYIVPQQQVNSE